MGHEVPKYDISNVLKLSNERDREDTDLMKGTGLSRISGLVAKTSEIRLLILCSCLLYEKEWDIHTNNEEWKLTSSYRRGNLHTVKFTQQCSAFVKKYSFWIQSRIIHRGLRLDWSRTFRSQNSKQTGDLSAPNNFNPNSCNCQIGYLHSGALSNFTGSTIYHCARHSVWSLDSVQIQVAIWSPPVRKQKQDKKGKMRRIHNMKSV